MQIPQSRLLNITSFLGWHQTCAKYDPRIWDVLRMVPLIQRRGSARSTGQDRHVLICPFSLKRKDQRELASPVLRGKIANLEGDG